MRLPRASTLLALGRGGLPRASPRLLPSMRAASEGVREGEVGVYGPPIPGQAHDKRWGPSYVLNDGTNHPMIGFGTYKVGFIPASASAAAAGDEAAGAQGPSAADIVGDALAVGYQFLDCAQFYGNEKEVGKAISRSEWFDRDDLYLASKVWTDAIYEGRAAVRKQIDATLKALRTDRLDLYLVHWPVPGKHVDAYLELQDAVKAGKITSIGVSNYAAEDVDELLDHPGVYITPAVNQIELNPFLYRPKTLKYMADKGIVVQAYRALRDGKAFEDPTVLRVAAKHGKTAAQVMGAWCLAKGAVYMPKSTKKARMVENADVVSFQLDGDDLAALDALTTEDALAAFKALYEKCVVRDTPLSEDDPGIKRDITAG